MIFTVSVRATPVSTPINQSMGDLSENLGVELPNTPYRAVSPLQQLPSTSFEDTGAAGSETRIPASEDADTPQGSKQQWRSLLMHVFHQLGVLSRDLRPGVRNSAVKVKKKQKTKREREMHARALS